MKNNQKGFSLLDSLVALVIFGTILAIYERQEYNNQLNLTAKSYADKTLTYANFYVDYLNSTKQQIATSDTQKPYLNISWYQFYEQLLKTNPSKVYYISPEQVYQFTDKISNKPSTKYNVWNTQLPESTIFHEFPCVALGWNAKLGSMYGIMYYASDGKKYKNKINIATKAGLTIQSKGAIYTVDKMNTVKILSPDGWQPNFYFPISNGGATTCKGYISPNSPIINLDMFLGFNQRMLQVNSLLKTNDQKYNSNNLTANNNTRYLPGHILNSNTLKSNITLGNGEAITFDKTKNIALNVAYGTDNSATLNMGTNATGDSTVLLADTIQPNAAFQSGQSCTIDEIGKTVINAGNPNNNPNDPIALKASKNLLVCTNNKLLCSNTGNNCFLPANQNKFNFMAASGGSLTDSTGNFMCPSYAPFASNANAAPAYPNVLVFVNNGSGGQTSGATISAYMDNGNATWQWENIGNSGPYYYVYYGQWKWFTSIDFAKISGTPTLSLPTSSGYITGSISDGATTYTVNKGYNIQSIGSCSTACNTLGGTIGGGTWDDINKIVVKNGCGTYNGVTHCTQVVNIPSGACGCGRLNGTRLDGIAMIKAIPTTLQSIQCSNTPDYQIQ